MIVDREWSRRFTTHLSNDNDKTRFEAEDIGFIQHWFDCLEIMLKTRQILPKNMYILLAPHISIFLLRLLSLFCNILHLRQKATKSIEFALPKEHFDLF